MDLISSQAGHKGRTGPYHRRLNIENLNNPLLDISHTKTCQLFPAKIEILDLIEFFVDLKNPKIHPDPFSEGLL